MGPFGTPRSRSATLGRREMLVGGAALLVAACDQPMPLTASRTPKLDMKRLNRGIRPIAARAAPGVLGAGLMNLESGQFWTFNGERRFPMMSVFKAPLGAMVLAEAESRRLDLAETVRIGEMDLAPPFSPIAEAWPGRQDYALGELLVAAVGRSDNTAADVLLRRVGGPGALTAWLQTRGVEEVRVDRYERELAAELSGMAPFRPEWRGARFLQLRETVPPDVRRAALARYLSDPRDTATPRGMLGFLARLDGGELIAPASASRLLEIMAATPTGPNRLKAGFPKTAVVAHKTGNGPTTLGVNAAANDVGVISLKDKRSYAAAVFLSGSTLDEAGRDKVIGDVARLMGASLG